MCSCSSREPLTRGTLGRDVASGEMTADNRSVRKALRRTGRWIWSARRLMLLLGALLVLAFPALNLEWLAWFGLVPGLLLIARSPTAREGGIRAWWLGAGYLIAALYWMAPELGPAVLVCTTELASRAAIDRLVAALADR